MIRIVTMGYVLLLAAGLATAGETAAKEKVDPDEPREALKEYNLERNRLGLKGYSPVSYIEKKKAEKGGKDHTYTYRGVTYRFTSARQIETFRKDPEKYEPAYGGWCAWAMKTGDKADFNPKAFKIVDGRLLVFYDGLFGDTLEKWNEAEADDAAQIAAADEQWRKISGEDPPGLNKDEEEGENGAGAKGAREDAE